MSAPAANACIVCGEDLPESRPGEHDLYDKELDGVVCRECYRFSQNAKVALNHAGIPSKPQ